MSADRYISLLDKWENSAAVKSSLVSEQIAINTDDAVKLEALARIYNVPKDEVVAQVLHLALQEIEEHMPYIPGTKVIRVEEGNEIYEDVGPMPRYLQAQRAIRSRSG